MTYENSYWHSSQDQCVCSLAIGEEYCRVTMAKTSQPEVLWKPLGGSE